MGLEKTSCRASALGIAHLHSFTVGLIVEPSVSLIGFSLEWDEVHFIDVTLMGLEDA